MNFYIIRTKEEVFFIKADTFEEAKKMASLASAYTELEIDNHVELPIAETPNCILGIVTQ